MSRLGDLPFDFEHGTCGTFMIHEIPKIFLCFPNREFRKCRSLSKHKNDLWSHGFDFETKFSFETMRNTIYRHQHSKIANYRGFPLVLGSWMDPIDGVKLEMFDTTKSEWFPKNDYPFSPTGTYCHYSVVSLATSVLYFGGSFWNPGSYDVDIVAEFRNDKWKKHGYMSQPRSCHRSIDMNNKIFIFGGYSSRFLDKRLKFAN